MINKLGDSCCGCNACGDVCPHGAIIFKMNKEGFLFPHIDAHKCTVCNICEKICPIIQPSTGNTILSSYAAYSHEKPSTSSSGGMFSVFASEIISINGVVYGAAYNNQMYLKHTRITNSRDINKLCGSKYVQSDCSGIYKQVKKDLFDNRIVLFSGTPCQVAALRNFLRKDYDNLILIDLICHGVPSPGLFADYLKFCSQLRGKGIDNFIIRDNREGWDNNFRSTITYAGGKKEYNSMLTNLWNRIFFSELAIRKNCKQCNFANMNRIGDISLGDFWGIEKIKPTMYNKSGVSLLLINSNKGYQLFHKIKHSITADLATTCEKEHPNLYHSTRQNPHREEFMKDYLKSGFAFIANKYFGYNKILDFKVQIILLINKFKHLCK